MNEQIELPGHVRTVSIHEGSIKLGFPGAEDAQAFCRKLPDPRLVDKELGFPRNYRFDLLTKYLILTDVYWVAYEDCWVTLGQCGHNFTRVDKVLVLRILQIEDFI